MTNQHIIHATQTWLRSFIINFNICPFARREHERNSIRYQVVDSKNLEKTLNMLIQECEQLDADAETETTLLILATGWDDFNDYLDLLAIAEQLLIEQGYEGIYQLASFHPAYRFETDFAGDEDPANYTNRSPYPMLHIIRETSIDRALAHYPDPNNIPARNIKLTRELGLEKLRSLLVNCYE